MPRALYRTSTTKIWNATLGAFGETVSEQVDPDGDGKQIRVPFRLPGQFALTDKEGGNPVGGFVENWNRIYDVQLGRYLQPDQAGIMPLGGPYAGSPFGMPGGMNQNYGYAAQSPLAWSDPDAESPEAAAAAAAAVALADGPQPGPADGAGLVLLLLWTFYDQGLEPPLASPMGGPSPVCPMPQATPVIPFPKRDPEDPCYIIYRADVLLCNGLTGKPYDDCVDRATKKYNKCLKDKGK